MSRKKNRENEREKEIKEILKGYKISSRSIEGKGGANAYVPDVMCWNEDGEVFFLEVKDGSIYSDGQLYMLTRLVHDYGAEKTPDGWRFYKMELKEVINNKLTFEQIEVSLYDILQKLKRGDNEK